MANTASHLSTLHAPVDHAVVADPELRLLDGGHGGRPPCAPLALLRPPVELLLARLLLALVCEGKEGVLFARYDCLDSILTDRITLHQCFQSLQMDSCILASDGMHHA